MSDIVVVYEMVMSSYSSVTHNLSFELDSQLFVFDGCGTVISLVQEDCYISNISNDLQYTL